MVHPWLGRSVGVVLIHAAPVTESDDARIMAVGGGLLLTVPAGSMGARSGQLPDICESLVSASLELCSWGSRAGDIDGTNSSDRVSGVATGVCARSVQ